MPIKTTFQVGTATEHDAIDNVNALNENFGELGVHGYGKGKSCCVPVYLAFTQSSINNSILRAKTHSSADTVLLSIMYNHASDTSDVMTAVAENSKLVPTIQYAQSIGLTVGVRIHTDRTTTLNPANPATWFANYTAVVNNVSATCTANNVEFVGVTNEHLTMTTRFRSEWEALFTNIKTTNPAIKYFTTFSYDEWEVGTLVADLPHILAVNIYPQCTTLDTAETADNMYASFYGSFSNVDLVGFVQDVAHEKNGRELWITEIGCISKVGVLENTALWGLGGAYSEETQEFYYKFMFDSFWGMHDVDLMSLWSIGSDYADQSYNYQYKLAETIVNNYWSKA